MRATRGQANHGIACAHLRAIDNRIALDNIRERMELLYPGRSSVEASRIGDEYIVRLRFPYVEDGERTSSL